MSNYREINEEINKPRPCNQTLKTGEYYWDEEGQLFGPIVKDEHGTFSDGTFIRNAYGESIQTISPKLWKLCDRSNPVHPKNNEYLEECNLSKAEIERSCDIADPSNYADPINCGLGTPPLTQKEEYVLFVRNLFTQMEELIRQKNSDYSHGDDPFANFRKSEDIGITPLAGLVLRIQDKMQRVNAYLLTDGDLQVPNEGVEDAFRDLIGYSCLALGMLSLDKKDDNDSTV